MNLRVSYGSLCTLGTAISDRLANEPHVDRRVADARSELASACTRLAAANAACDEADTAHASRIRELGESNVILDASFEILCQELAAAGLGTRRRPIGAFADKSPSDVKKLPPAAKARTVASLCRAVLDTKPPKRVLEAVDRASEAARGVRAAVATVVAADSKCRTAGAKRHDAANAVKRTILRARKHVEAAYFGDDETIAALFAAPTRGGRAPKRKRKKTAGNERAADAPAGEKPRRLTTPPPALPPANETVVAEPTGTHDIG